MTDIDKLRTKAEAATPGPWALRYTLGRVEWPLVIADGFGAIPDVTENAYANPADADYIAAVSPDVVLALLARIEAQDKAIREALANMWRYCGEYPDDKGHDVVERILSSVLEQTPEPPEPEWEYGVIGPTGRMVNNGDYTREQTHRRRKAGPWEPWTHERNGR